MTASMRVVASHLHMRHVSAEHGPRAVLEAAQRAAAGGVTPEIERLMLRLEKATVVSIAEFARHAAAWPV